MTRDSGTALSGLTSETSNAPMVGTASYSISESVEAVLLGVFLRSPSHLMSHAPVRRQGYLGLDRMWK